MVMCRQENWSLVSKYEWNKESRNLRNIYSLQRINKKESKLVMFFTVLREGKDLKKLKPKRLTPKLDKILIFL